jgi:hypothetical protein
LVSDEVWKWAADEDIDLNTIPSPEPKWAHESAEVEPDGSSSDSEPNDSSADLEENSFQALSQASRRHSYPSKPKIHLLLDVLNLLDEHSLTSSLLQISKPLTPYTHSPFTNDFNTCCSGILWKA